MSENLEDLEDYVEDPDHEAPTGETAQKKATVDTHVGVHAAGFREFLLKPELMRAIADCGFEHPSEVQNEAIPQAILGTDIICQAKSGMGKTAVFVLAVLQQLNSEKKGVQALVLAHTRELSFQILSEFDRFKRFLPDVSAAVFYGGVPVATNIEAIKTEPKIVIGTPGRLAQLIEEKHLNLENLKYFVLDECDSMLESLEMRRDVQKIFRATPHTKQVMMFSATLSDAIRPVCKKFMNEPLEIYVNEGAKLTLHGLQQYFIQLQESEKNRKLVDLLDALEFNQLVIFVKSVGRATELNKLLIECNFPSIAIHGQMKQPERIAKYKEFKEFHKRIMVATNLFGRGIDISRVNVVINYDMAESTDTYLHRVGRAGRFGTKGLAISFISSGDDGTVLNNIQKLFSVNIPQLPDEIDASTYMQS